MPGGRTPHGRGSWLVDGGEGLWSYSFESAEDFVQCGYSGEYLFSFFAQDEDGDIYTQDVIV